MKNKFALYKWGILIFIGIIFANALNHDSLNNAQGYHFSNRVAVLEYHHIDPEASSYTVTPDMFRQHLIALKENHYHVISMEQFVQFLRGKGTVPPDAVVITFDDGYESFYQYAYPILKEEGMVGTNFLIVGYLGQTMGLPFLHWDEIEQMHKDGFSFYSHTYYSHDFAADAQGNPIDSLTTPIYLKEQNRTETDSEYRLRVKSDLEKADQLIAEHLGPQIQLFCFPHGRYNQTLLQLANETGIHYFFTGIDGLNTPGTTLVRRISAGTDKVTSKKLLQKLNDETTLLGRMKIKLKNVIVSQRGSD